MSAVGTANATPVASRSGRETGHKDLECTGASATRVAALRPCAPQLPPPPSWDDDTAATVAAPRSPSKASSVTAEQALVTEMQNMFEKYEKRMVQNLDLWARQHEVTLARLLLSKDRRDAEAESGEDTTSVEEKAVWSSKDSAACPSRRVKRTVTWAEGELLVQEPPAQSTDKVMPLEDKKTLAGKKQIPHQESRPADTGENIFTRTLSDEADKARQKVDYPSSRSSAQSSRFRNKDTCSFRVEDEARRAAAIRVSFGRKTSSAISQVEASCSLFFQRLVKHPAFEIFVGLTIITNAVFIGVEVEYFARNPGTLANFNFYIINCTYSLVFLLELLCRLCGDGCSFFSRETLYWNLLDLFLVASALVESIVDTVIMVVGLESGGVEKNLTGFRIARVLRVLRFVRTLRISRIIRFVAALRTLVYSILVTLRALIWALLLLVMIMYVFGIVFTQSTGDYFADHGRQEDLDSYWGSLPSSMFTLFMSISGGISWSDAATPLYEVSILLVALLTAFIFFVYFAVLNVVTGFFCQSAIETAQCDPDLAAQANITSRQNYIARLKQLFESMDSDKSGQITLAELDRLMTDERVQADFAAIDLDADDAWTVFKQLDTNHSHTIDIDEFVLGIMRLRGPAKGIDMHTLMAEHRRLMRRLSTFMKYVESELPLKQLQ